MEKVVGAYFWVRKKGWGSDVDTPLMGLGEQWEGTWESNGRGVWRIEKYY